MLVGTWPASSQVDSYMTQSRHSHSQARASSATGPITELIDSSSMESGSLGKSHAGGLLQQAACNAGLQHVWLAPSGILPCMRYTRGPSCISLIVAIALPQYRAAAQQWRAWHGSYTCAKDACLCRHSGRCCRFFAVFIGEIDVCLKQRVNCQESFLHN